MMEIFRADLHCHSTYSDGTLSPRELIDMAKEIGLGGLSITDHDTIETYPEAASYAQSQQIQLLSGVEFSAQHHGTSVHILGYAFSPNNRPLQAFCEKHKARRQKRQHKILKLLATNGITITEEEVRRISPEGTLGRPHIAQVLLDKGYAKSVKDALLRFLVDGQPAYVKGEPFSAEETIEVIHRAGGLAIIAHPHLIPTRSTVKQLLQLNFDGLEGFYARMGMHANERWITIAKEKGWLITGGSDFHGTAKTYIQLGCSWTNEDTFQQLQDHAASGAGS